MKVKKTLCAFLALVMILGLAACGNPQDETPGAGGTAATPGTSATTPGSTGLEAGDDAPDGIVPGTELKIAVSADIVNYIPLGTNNKAAISVNYNIYDQLFTYYKGEILNSLCESYTVSEDGLLWTIKLREDVDFINGDHMTSKDVVSSFEAKMADNAADAAFLNSVEADGDYTVLLKLNYPTADLPAQICYSNWSIVAASAYEEFGCYDNKAAVGTGPYYVESYVPGQSLIMKANENYWDKEHMPHIETIEYVVITDANSAWIAVQNGDVDVSYDLTYLQYQQLSQDDNFAIFVYNNPSNDSLWFNTAAKPLDDPAVREAMEYLINKDDVNYAATDGTGSPTNCPWFDESAMFTSDEYLGQVYTYDVDKGLQILKDAGYEPKDISFDILAPTSSDAECRMAENIQAQLLALGMIVTVTTYDRPTYLTYIRDRDYQSCIHDAGSAIVNLATVIANTWNSSGVNHFNNWDISDPEYAAQVDAMIAEARACVDYDQQIEILKQITKMMYERAAEVPLLRTYRWFAYNADLRGMHFNETNNTAYFRDAYWVA